MTRAKSSRKIVSKLAGHLEPGTLATVRVIEQHGAQVIDALKIASTNTAIQDLSTLSNLLPEWQPDAELWAELQQPFSWQRVLAVLGWDPEGAECVRCGRMAAQHFHIPRQEFFCASCAVASRFGRDKILLVS
jgi:recombinational DNA repair protein (RecF pathway)